MRSEVRLPFAYGIYPFDNRTRKPDTVVFAESPALQRIRDEYARSPRGFDDSVRAAVAVGEIVRNGIRFGALGGSLQLMTPEDINKSKVTHCLGEAIIASECLELLGIEHYLCFANTHGFIGLFNHDDNGKQAFMVTPRTPALNVPFDKAIGGVWPDIQLAEGRTYAANSLYTDYIQVDAPNGRADFVGKNLWFRFNMGSGSINDQAYAVQNQRLLMRVYRPGVGRQVFRDYSDLHALYLRKNVGEAARKMSGLSGLFPEMDRRNNLGILPKIRNELVQRGEYELALAIGSAVAKSLSGQAGGESIYFWPDTLVTVGEKAKCVEMIKEAELVVSKFPRTSFCRGKLKAIVKALEAASER